VIAANLRLPGMRNMSISVAVPVEPSKFPLPGKLVMSQDIERFIIRPDFEIAVIFCGPPIDNFADH
jgi:hypothetical protein